MYRKWEIGKLNVICFAGGLVVLGAVTGAVGSKGWGLNVCYDGAWARFKVRLFLFTLLCLML